MKRFLAVFLAVVMAMACFAGCGDNPEKADNNEVSGSVDKSTETSLLSINDVMEVTEKLNEGTEFSTSLNINVVPEEETDLSELEDSMSFFIKKNEDGSYGINVSLIGKANEKGVSVTIKLGDKELSDVIVTENMDMYINFKDIISFVYEVIGLPADFEMETEYVTLDAMVESGLLDGFMPVEEEFIEEDFVDVEINEILEEDFYDEKSDPYAEYDSDEYIEEDSYSDFSISDIMSLMNDEETVKEIQSTIELVTNIVIVVLSDDVVEAFAKDIVEAVKNAKVVTITSDSVVLDINAASIKNATNSIIDIINADGANAIIAGIDALKASDKIEQDIKDSITDVEKEELQSNIKDSFDKEEIGKAIDEFAESCGNPNLKVTVKVEDNGLDVKASASMNPSAEMSMGFKGLSIEFTTSMKANKVDEIKAPATSMDAKDFEDFMYSFGM